eukprot:451419-Rhodomonas_salina.2
MDGWREGGGKGGTVSLARGRKGISGTSDRNGAEVLCLDENARVFLICAGEARLLKEAAGSGAEERAGGRKGKAVNLSEDHKPMNDTERERIEKANGFVE